MGHIAQGISPHQNFIIVSHINPTSVPLIKTLAKYGRLAGIIAKPNSIDFRTYEALSDMHRFIKLTKEDFHKNGIISEKISPLISPGEKLTIVDIGGYFAPALKELNQLPNITGIIEDTENGLQKYEKALAAYPENKIPLLSIARSRAKDFEDYLIGRSIAVSTIDTMAAEYPIEQAQIGIIGFGEVGRGAAFYLRDTLKLCPKIYDCSTKVQDLIRLSGFTNINREDILTQSNILICATGHHSLNDQDIKKLKPGVLISSCTSGDDEFAFKNFSIQNGVPITKNITQHQGINFINKGNAVNFLHPDQMEKMLSPYIYLTHSALLLCAVKLNQKNDFNPAQITSLLPQEENKLIHNFRASMKNKNVNSVFVNRILTSNLSRP